MPNGIPSEAESALLAYNASVSSANSDPSHHSYETRLRLAASEYADSVSGIIGRYVDPETLAQSIRYARASRGE